MFLNPTKTGALNKRSSAARMAFRWCWLGVAAVAAGSSSAADIQFSNVALDAGVAIQGPTAGSAWGDANADDLPDLWVSSHHGKAPSLFLNNGDGTFSDAADQLPRLDQGVPDGWPDFHGAAWADADNDGDQDLLVVTGAGAGRGESANLYFENDGTATFTERAKATGLDYPRGRGRTPLWLDVNHDGQLDVLLMNRARAIAPSAIMVQDSDGTFSRSHDLATPNTAWYENTWLAVRRFFHAGPAEVSSAMEFAQLGDLLPNQPGLEVITYDKSVALWQSSAAGLTQMLDWPVIEPEPAKSLRGIQDAIVADFDGDLASDWLLIRSRPWMQQVVKVADDVIEANLAGTTDAPNVLLLTTSGDLEVALFPPWYDPSDPRSEEQLPIFAGSKSLALSNNRLSLTTTDSSLHIAPSPSTQQEPAVHIRYFPKRKQWKITNSTGPLNVIARTTADISEWAAKGFKPGPGTSKNVLLFNNTTLSPAQQEFEATPCQSAAAADFDNDMDIDVYMVCTSGVADTDDLLLQNDGNGKFTVHPMGASSGRGNQVASADYNNDGFVDLAVTNGAGAPPFSQRGTTSLLQNQPNENHWLQLKLQGTTSNRDAIGASVIVHTGAVAQLRSQDGGMHSFSQNHQRLHFGLGTHSIAQRVEIQWPGGSNTVLENVAADQILQISEPAAADAANE